MSENLSDMTLKELWQLFPIFLVEHNPEWKNQYEDEKRHISSVVPQKMIHRISHISSTAIPGIWAKNIVDMLLEVADKKILCL